MKYHLFEIKGQSLIYLDDIDTSVATMDPLHIASMIVTFIEYERGKTGLTSGTFQVMTPDGEFYHRDTKEDGHHWVMMGPNDELLPWLLVPLRNSIEATAEARVEELDDKVDTLEERVRDLELEQEALQETIRTLQDANEEASGDLGGIADRLSNVSLPDYSELRDEVIEVITKIFDNINENGPDISDEVTNIEQVARDLDDARP